MVELHKKMLVLSGMNFENGVQQFGYRTDFSLEWRSMES